MGVEVVIGVGRRWVASREAVAAPAVDDGLEMSEAETSGVDDMMPFADWISVIVQVLTFAVVVAPTHPIVLDLSIKILIEWQIYH